MSKKPESLWKLYAVALCLILTVLLVGHLIESHAIKSARKDAEVIKLSAKQTTLSQQIILSAQAVVSEGSEEASQTLNSTVDRFERAHYTLMTDAERAESLGSLYMARTPSTDEIVLNYIAVARSIPSARYPAALYDELEQKGKGIVLERLEEAAIAYDRRTRDQSEWIHILQEITLVVAAVIILLEAFLIFLPAHLGVKRGMRNLRTMAETDQLTNLRNRSGFDRDIAVAMSSDLNEHQSLSLVLLDLDDFKGINDRYGHLFGDAVLKVIGDRISRLPNLISTARVGGDEFAILVDNTNWDTNDSIDQIDRDIRECMNFVYRPIEHDGVVINVSGSVGLSRFPQDAANLSDLRRNASIALLDAKRTGRASLSIYDERIDTASKKTRSIQSALLSGEYKKHASVCFQPIVEVSSSKTKSVEALARWEHPEFGSLNPELFFSIARDCGLGDEVDTFFRTLALKQMSSSLCDRTIESLSLNVSPVDLSTLGFAGALLEQIASAKANPSHIWIEVTETERLTGWSTVKENLELLNEQGVRVALDDYGVGYSNVQRLAELPIERVKIDKSIVTNIVANPKYAGVFRSSVQLARALGAEIVAEGVETEDQLRHVRHRGCDLVQGYLFSRPLRLSECLATVTTRMSAVA